MLIRNRLKEEGYPRETREGSRGGISISLTFS